MTDYLNSGIIDPHCKCTNSQGVISKTDKCTSDCEEKLSGCSHKHSFDCLYWDNGDIPEIGFPNMGSGTLLIEKLIEKLKEIIEQRNKFKGINVGKGQNIYKGFNGNSYEFRRIHGTNGIKVQNPTPNSDSEDGIEISLSLKSEELPAKENITLSNNPTEIVSVYYCGALLPKAAWEKTPNGVAVDLSVFGLSIGQNEKITVTYKY